MNSESNSESRLKTTKTHVIVQYAWVKAKTLYQSQFF
jgi:hypothetical protein